MGMMDSTVPGSLLCAILGAAASLIQLFQYGAFCGSPIVTICNQWWPERALCINVHKDFHDEMPASDIKDHA